MSADRKVREATSDERDLVRKARGPRSVDERTTAHASPARNLQSSLAESLETSLSEEPQRWPGAVRMTIICGGSALLWTGIAAVCKAVLSI